MTDATEYTFQFFYKGAPIVRADGSPTFLRLTSEEMELVALTKSGNLSLHPAPIPIELPIRDGINMSERLWVIDMADRVLVIDIAARMVQLRREGVASPGAEREAVLETMESKGYLHSALIATLMYDLGSEAGVRAAARVTSRLLGEMDRDTVVGFCRRVPRKDD